MGTDLYNRDHAATLCSKEHGFSPGPSPCSGWGTAHCGLQAAQTCTQCALAPEHVVTGPKDASELHAHLAAAALPPSGAARAEGAARMTRTAAGR